MPHVGNDIVDLTHPDAKGKSRNIRFLRRVCTPDEQERLTRACCPDGLLWAFWAAKETAYKIVSKIHPAVSSAPRLYRVRYDRAGEGAATDADLYVPGLVGTPCGDVSIGTFISGEYVHCLGVAGPQADLRKIVWEIKRIPGNGNPAATDESRFVREAAGRRLSGFLETDPADIEIRRRVPSGRGAPLVYCRGRRAAVDISLSHDGRFAAYAFLPDGTGLRRDRQALAEARNDLT